MTLQDLAQGEPWMNQQEHHTVAGLVQSFRESFAERGIPETPFLVLRVRDVLVSHALCRRLEQNLSLDADADTVVTPALAGHIGRALDRLRKSLKELEITANKLVPGADPAVKATRLPGSPKPAPGGTSPSNAPSGTPSPVALAQKDALSGGSAPSPQPIPVPVPQPPTTPAAPAKTPPCPAKPALPLPHPAQAPKPFIYVPKPSPFDRNRNK